MVSGIVIVLLSLFISGSGNTFDKTTAPTFSGNHTHVSTFTGNYTTVSTFTRNHTKTNVSTRTFCPRQAGRMDMALFGSLIVFIPITIIGNGLVWIVIFYTRTLRKQPMYLFLASLAVADTIVGCFSFPLKAKQSWDGGCLMLSPGVCWTFVLGEPTFALVSIFHLFAVAIDRYLALKYTFGYSNMMTRRRSIFVIFAIWMFSLVWALFIIPRWSPPYITSIVTGGPLKCALYNDMYFKVTYYLWVILPTFVMLFLYLFIYKTAIHHVNEIAKLEVRDSTSLTEQVRRKKQLKLVSSIVVVFLAFAICWIPLALFVLIVYDNSELYKKNMLTDWSMTLKFIFTSFLPALSSAINPFIYVITNNTFVTAFHSLFTKVTGIDLQKKDGSINSENTKQSVYQSESYQMKKSSTISPMSGIVNEVAFHDI